jgi:hypothetical protein
MTTPRATSSVDVILTAGEPRPVGRPAQDVPFRMLIMGNFSGRDSRLIALHNGRRRPGTRCE